MTRPQEVYTLYVASSNAGKLRDFATVAEEFSGLEITLMSECRFTIAPLPGLALIPVPSEGGATFEENARAKAVYYSLYAASALVIADDSGLEVDALGGAPGIYSARFAERVVILPANTTGSKSDAGSLDLRNNELLLHKLAGVGTIGVSVTVLDQRQARYRCVLAAARNGECVATAEGSVEGVILHEPRGSGGFGYDPLFYLPAMECTMAELDAATRVKVSHRGAALRVLLPILLSQVDSEEQRRGDRPRDGINKRRSRA